MRRLLYACLVCLFVVMTTADRVACLDGCADDAAGDAAPGHASAACSFCQGWSHSPVARVARPAPRVLAPARAPRVTLLAPALPPFEPPPKAA